MVEKVENHLKSKKNKKALKLGAFFLVLVIIKVFISLYNCGNLKVTKEKLMEKKLIAIATNGSNLVSLVKSVNEQEYKTLINNQEKDLAKREKVAIEHEQQHESAKKSIKHLEENEIIVAKSVYDNFVDRGLIDNDDSFQKMWFDFYFNNGELNLDNAPQEYKQILLKVREM